ncbi:hypothetical protein ACGFZL_14550 [Streptomyces sp. NPDC048182]|uniref:hypothetical protein n=1 Tax=Streptomyces sp. NPDC048182 TaxID=3365507 RepID=UPI0037241A56
METIIASAIAVLGTLLGSGITLAFQQRVSDRGHAFTRRETLRQERLDAYSAYVVAASIADSSNPLRPPHQRA